VNSSGTRFSPGRFWCQEDGIFLAWYVIVTGLEFFTLGGALSRLWRPNYPLLPWALTSALLMVAGLWDHWVDRGPVEWIVVGLAAYELMMGLLSDKALAGYRQEPVPVHDTSDPGE
jgi:hypothetical protein